jgi:hypothetical protein
MHHNDEIYATVVTEIQRENLSIKDVVFTNLAKGMVPNRANLLETSIF